MTQLDGDAIDAFLLRLEKGYQDEADRLLSVSSRDIEGIHRMRGAASAAASIRKQLRQFKISSPQSRTRSTAKSGPTKEGLTETGGRSGE